MLEKKLYLDAFKELKLVLGKKTLQSEIILIFFIAEKQNFRER